MQIPLRVTGDKWTVLCVDGHSYLDDLVNVNSKFHSNKTKQNRPLQNVLLKKIKLGATMLVKDIFVSETFIPKENLPKTMRFLNCNLINWGQKFLFQVKSLNQKLGVENKDNKENIAKKQGKRNKLVRKVKEIEGVLEEQM